MSRGTLVALVIQAAPAQSQTIATAHVYHNPMPNFWAYYGLTQYASTPVSRLAARPGVKLAPGPR